jgi:hypothetical protein
VRQSGLYRWLTTEPDHEVITIDVTDSLIGRLTVPPLYRTVRWVLPRWRGSRTKRVVEFLNTQFTDHPVRVFGVLLVSTVLTRFTELTVTDGFSIRWALVAVALIGIGAVLIQFEPSLSSLRETRLWRLLVAPPRGERSNDENTDE